MTTTPDARGIASAIDQLRDSIDDATPEHFVLTMVSLAFSFDRAAEVEAALEPLMDEWLEQSLERLVVSDQQREDAIHGCQVEVCHQ